MVRLESKRQEAVGRYINVGTFKAHCFSKGEGNTAFVFITGSGTPSAYTDFYYLQNELAEKGQTIVFDHAGNGFSTSTESPRNIENLVRELSVIIDTIVPEKPVVFLCHSLGSLEAIAYAQKNPKRVAGIVFLDSGTPEFYSRDTELSAVMINRSLAFTRIIGLNRLLGEFGFLLPVYGQNIRNQQLPNELQRIDKVMYYQFAGNPSSIDSMRLMNENAEAVLAGSLLGSTPILVLSSDSGKKWNEVQLQLAAWSTNSKQVTMKGAEHYLHWSSYQEVMNYISQFIEENKW